MCRIFGMTGVPEWDLLEDLGLEFQEANFHAAGVAIWTPDNAVCTIKQPGLWEDLISTPQWEKFREKKAIAAICHVRHATVGDPRQNKNNHPFKTECLVGFHHGVIQNHRRFQVERTSEVDSEVIFRLLETQGAVDKMVGWGAIAYFDLRQPGVTFLGSSRLSMNIDPKGEQSRLFISSYGGVSLGWSVAPDWIMRVEQDGLMCREQPFVLGGYLARGWTTRRTVKSGAVSQGQRGGFVKSG